MNLKKVLFSALMLTATGAAIAVTEPETNVLMGGVISGRVVDAEHQALPGATIMVEDLHTGVTSDVNGFYTLPNMKPGTYKVKVSYVGYSPKTYVIKLVFSYNIMPKWLVIILMIAMFGTIPATLIDVLQASGIDLTLFPLIRDIFYISQKITYIVLYIVLISNACQLTESWIFRIVFVIIGFFLIFCVVVEWIPSIAEHLPVPLIGFKGAV